jgi:hypothetical protein
MVYTRPPPFPDGSHRKFNVKPPVISQSGAWFPSLRPFTDSLLVTAMFLETTLPPQLSAATTVIVTGTMLWLGGDRTLGIAVSCCINGGVVWDVESRQRGCA